MKLLLFALVLPCVIYSEENVSYICDNCTCNSILDVLTIDCSNKDFSQILTAWPQNNTEIVALWGSNTITTLEPLPHTDALIEIVLSDCKIQYLKPNLFTATKNIKFVDLSYNLLTDEEVTSEKFKGPYNETTYEPIALEHLNLSYNRIHRIEKNLFEHMPNLKTLDLEGNKFYVLDIHTQLALNSIKSLQILNLANNKMSELIKLAIEGHDQLIELNLANNQFDFVPSSLTYVANSLKTLTLDGNPIIEMTDESFLGLSNLQVLSVNNLTKLRYIVANTFEPLVSLKKLSLCDNFALKDIDREAFGINQTLDEFYLINNDLYRLDYKLLPWSKLSVFEFKDNPFDCSCDLYNITQALTRDIQKIEDLPYCRNLLTAESTRVIELTSDICTQKSLFTYQREFIQYHFSLVKTILIILSVIVMMTAFMAALLGYMRYRKYSRGRQYPFATQVLYNPLSTNVPRF